MAGLKFAARAFVPVVLTVPYVGTYFDSGLGFNMNYLGMFTAPQTMSGPLTTPTASNVVEPALSPDESVVAFIEANLLWTMDADGANVAQLQDTGAGDYAGNVSDSGGFQWAPDSSHILFAPDTDSSPPDTRIYTIDLAGDTTTLYDHGGSSKVWTPRYNPAGTKIMFSVVTSSSLVQIWVMDADGTNAAQVETVPTQFSGVRTAQWEGDDRFVWNDGTNASPVYKGQDIAGGNIITLGSGSANAPRRQSETLNPNGLGYLAWAPGTPTDINSVAYDGSGSTDFVTLASAVTANLFTTPAARFDSRMWWDVGNAIHSAPLSDLTDQRVETINGDGVGVNFGLSG